MFTNAELDVSSEAIEHYKTLAQEYLQAIQATVEVMKAGEDDDGKVVFGICLLSYDGRQEWYDPTDEKNVNAMVGWNTHEDAAIVLTEKVLPNLGYTIHCKELREFHRNLG